MPVTPSDSWLVWSIASPLALALAAFVLGNRWCAHLGMAATVIITTAAGAVTWRVWHFGPQIYPLGNWLAPLGIGLHADGLSCAMLLMSASVGAVVSVYSLSYFAAAASGTPNLQGHLFWPLWLLLWSALNALFLAADVFNLYVALELLTLAAVGLVALANSRVASEAALQYLLAALAGSLMYLAGVAILYAELGTLDISALGRASSPSRALQFALLLVMLGLMLKTALFPFHFWLPPAHGSAPAPVSALLSGLVVKGSFYILLRLWFEIFPSEITRPMAIIPAGLGGAAIVWGSIQAVRAKRLKMLVAYSTVAQIGYLFLVFFLASHASDTAATAWNACILFAMSHALAKGALFLAAGTILSVAGHDRIRDLPAVCRRMPITFFAMGIASVSLMGLPPTAAFLAKWMMLTAAFANGQVTQSVVIVLGGLLAAVYLYSILAAAFSQPDGESTTLSARGPRVMEYAVLALALGSLTLGLASAPLMDLLAIGSPWQSLQQVVAP